MLNTGYFISNKISRVGHGHFSYTVHRIAVISVAIGLGAAIVSYLVMRGFQHLVEDKMYRFGSHLLISKFTLNNSMEGQPFFFDINSYKDTTEGPYKYIDHMQRYGYMSGLIRTDTDALGILFKGVGPSFDVDNFSEGMVEGDFLHWPDSGYAKEVVLSRNIADKIEAKVQDDIIVHFFKDPPRFRKLRVVGIYETNLSDYFDNRMIIGDLRLIQRLNGWPDGVASGVEVYVRDKQHTDEVYTAIEKNLDYDLYVEKTRDKYSEVFSWLGLIGRQVFILLGVIFTVVCVNMIAIVLILVMERTPMIGLLKAMGASNWLVRTIFLYSGVHLVFKGLLYGNLLGLGLCFVQYMFKIITLNPNDYYMRFVPISWDWGAVLVLNFLVLVLIGVVLFIPTAIAVRTDPIKAIRFD